MPSPATIVKKQQRSWADNHKIEYDGSGYTLKLDDNLFKPLSAGSLSEFSDGDGGEMGTLDKRGKMQALHSSSALACNVFEFWRGRNASVLAQALELPKDIKDINFERKFKTGLPGNAPNLDVVLTSTDDSITAIESKFLEPYSSHQTGFKEKYFEPNPGRWDQAGFPNCQKLAHCLQSGDITFEWLHAEQLLKHILGLSKSKQSWKLLYLWYEVSGKAAYEHSSEVIKFSSYLKADGIPFLGMSYQSLFSSMQSCAGEPEREYLSYLGGRYFNVQA